MSENSPKPPISQHDTEQQLVTQDAGQFLSAVLKNPALLGMLSTWMQGRTVGLKAPGEPSVQVVDEFFMWFTMSNFFQQMANSTSVMQKKISAMEKLENWLHDIGRPLLAAVPEDIATYLTHWATNSGRYKVGNLQLCAPSSLRVLVSYLATEYDRFSATHGEWNPRTGSGKRKRKRTVM